MLGRHRNLFSRSVVVALAVSLCVPSFAAGAASAAGPPIGGCAPQAPGAIDDLPDLRMADLYGLTIRSTTGGRKRLRFGTKSWNIGEGPLEVRGDNRTDNTMGLVAQRIYDEQGGCRDVLQPLATMFHAGDGHNHWHVNQYMVSQLYVRGGGDVLRMRKTGFCLVDLHRGTDLPNNTPPDRVYWNGACGNSDSQSIAMGISVGYADDYTPLIAQQWIDITGLPRAVYRLCTTVNPFGWWLEENDRSDNNAYWIDLRINAARNRFNVIDRGRGLCFIPT